MEAKQTIVQPAIETVNWIDLWRRMQHVSGEYSVKLTRAMLWLIVATVCQGLAFACVMPIFDLLFVGQQGAGLWQWLLVMSGFSLVCVVARWRAQGFDFNGDMSQVTHELRAKLGRQLRIIPLEQLRNKRTGEVTATLLGNVDANLAYIVTIANLLLSALVCPIVIAICAFYYDWRLALILMLIFPALLPLYRWFAPKFSQGIDAYVRIHHQMNANIIEYVQGLAIIRSSGCVGVKAQQLQHSFRQLEQFQTQAQRSGTKPAILLASVFELGLLVVFIAGVYFVLQGWSQLPTLAAIIVIIMRFAEPLSSFVGYTKIIHLIDASLIRIETLLAIQALPQLAAQIPTTYDIEFKQVQFQYHDSCQPDLQEFNLVIPARQLTALVGPSGAGKTTVTRMIMRYADPQQGQVTIGGVDVRAIEPEQLNQLVSVVFQDVYLFDDTILANIRMARPDASLEQVIQAAKAANCHQFIEQLPLAYETQVGDIGGRLSGGERQRISIARAILKDSPILILDEPTAALDTESEVAVQSAIDNLVQDKTVIVIAHRLSTIVSASNIIVIEAGRVVEQGQHQELLAKQSRYCDLWRAQNSTKHWQSALESI